MEFAYNGFVRHPFLPHRFDKPRKSYEILRDFDIDVVGYILGYLSYSFGLQIVVNVAEKESGGDHGEDEHDVVNIKGFQLPS